MPADKKIIIEVIIPLLKDGQCICCTPLEITVRRIESLINKHSDKIEFYQIGMTEEELKEYEKRNNLKLNRDQLNIVLDRKEVFTPRQTVGVPTYSVQGSVPERVFKEKIARRY